jgi:hypothetical protein
MRQSDAMQSSFRLVLLFTIATWSTSWAVGKNDGKRLEPNTRSVEAPVELSRYIVTAPPAGRFSTGGMPSATLTPFELLMVPGSAADINRALQTLPGVQAADEGNALFVRGGDSRETAMWINGIRFPARAQFNTPLGSVAGAISPLQASSVEFAAGGFSADTGNVLSGAVKIKTVNAPRARGYSANFAVGGVAAAVAMPWSSTAGTTATIGRDDTQYFLKIFGATRTLIEAPNGYSASIAGSWDYRATGKIKWFLLGQGDRVALRMRDLRGAQVFRTEGDTGFQVVSWNDRWEAWKYELNVGGGQVTRAESMGAAHWRTRRANQQFSFTGARDAGRFVWRSGMEGFFEKGRFSRTLTAEETDGAFACVWETRSRERLISVWSEAETMVARDVRLVAGARGWDSQLAEQTGIDPRLSLTWQPKRGLTYSLAGGRYQQIPDAADYARAVFPWPAMRADQAIASVEWRRAGRLLRVETYEKHYRELVGADRNFLSQGGGRGQARGVDLLVKTPLVAEIKSRLTWSWVDAERTDPTTGAQAAAPWAVRHSASLILDRAIGNWQVSVAGRWATGRAFTPIVGAEENIERRPVFGEANSQRYPNFRRIDLTLVRTWQLSERVVAATYLAGFNLAGWKNVSGYEYSDDFSTRQPVPGVFGRSLYFGVNLNFR